MTPEEKAKITDLKKCDFSEMHQYFKAQTEARKAMTKEEKLVSPHPHSCRRRLRAAGFIPSAFQKIKEENERILQQFGFCIMDNHKERIANFRIEPPGLFRGRGDHPKMGMLKRRIRPEDIIINCSKWVARSAF